MSEGGFFQNERRFTTLISASLQKLEESGKNGKSKIKTRTATSSLRANTPTARYYNIDGPLSSGLSLTLCVSLSLLSLSLTHSRSLSALSLLLSRSLPNLSLSSSSRLPVCPGGGEAQPVHYRSAGRCCMLYVCGAQCGAWKPTIPGMTKNWAQQ